MAVDPKFITKVGNREFVLFAGLLDLAHQQGLKSISTEIIQIPTESNQDMAVMHAQVELEDGRTFGGTGDASPANVGRMIAPHVLRQAETRAVARALRMATNVGITAFEELGGDDAPVPPIDRPDPQDLLDIRSLAAEHVKGGVDGLEAALGCPLGAVSAVKAKQVLSQLQIRKAQKA